MKRTENSLDGKQVLSVIERYTMALDLLETKELRQPCFFIFLISVIMNCIKL